MSTNLLNAVNATICDNNVSTLHNNLNLLQEGFLLLFLFRILFYFVLFSLAMKMNFQRLREKRKYSKKKKSKDYISTQRLERWEPPYLQTKRQSMSPQTALLKTTLTRTIILHRLMTFNIVEYYFLVRCWERWPNEFNSTMLNGTEWNCWINIIPLHSTGWPNAFDILISAMLNGVEWNSWARLFDS